MSKPISFGKLDFEIVAARDDTPSVAASETPFRILILGDFSGRANRGLFEPGIALSSERCLEVDRDNIDQTIAGLGVELNIPHAGRDGSAVAIRFKDLDDFHPDNLYKRLDGFQTFSKIRRELADPQTAVSETLPTSKAEKENPPPDIAETATGSLLDQVIAQTPVRTTESDPPSDSSNWDAYLQEIVRPHLVPDTHTLVEDAMAAVDEAATAQMRLILHQRDFQTIEAAWRAVRFLVSKIETGPDLKLYLIDISKAELTADLTESEDLRSTGTYKLLVEQTVEAPGAEPWAVLAGNYTFDQTREDTEMLGRLAKIARQAGAPFLAAAHDHLLGCESLAETSDPDEWRRPMDGQSLQDWKALRKLPEAAYLGLALPRFMVRLPYGKETRPIESFNFEEMASTPDHNSYLWGNPAMACIYLLAGAFSAHGWNFYPGIIQDISGLPLHVYQNQAVSRIKPCAEVLLSDRAAERILDKGLMPLLSKKNQDVIRLARFQSLTDPASPLAGKWNG